jgi:ATPase subunit of ABC transporter with duplicated ATPase domains
VLDEPTTHLDILSREALEAMLQAFGGTIIFVSHDRHLISLLANNLLVITEGSVRHFAGSYQDLLKESNSTSSTKEEKKEKPVQLPPSKKTSRAKSTPKLNGAHLNRKPASRKEDHEKLISDLESQIEGLEKELQEASDTGNMDSITVLGKKHEKLNLKLDRAISRWIE